MVDWKPDKNKNCEKCEHYEPLIISESSVLGPSEASGDCCPFGCIDGFTGNYHETNEYLDLFYRIIEFVEDIRQNHFADGENAETESIVLANICPLYHEEEG
jgi:hypothetical protein